MADTVDLHPWHKDTPAHKRPRRRIVRDFLAVLVVGTGIGLALAWTDLDPTKARSLINEAADQVQELATTSSPGPDIDDTFLVASIGKKSSSKAAHSASPLFRGHYPVCGLDVATRDNCVVDGDTIRLDGTTIRISDIDAPETHPPRCAREADLGDRATRRLSQLLSDAPFQLVRHGRDLDRYGRKLRVVMRDGKSIGGMLVSEELARPWTGKRRPWCGTDAAG